MTDQQALEILKGEFDIIIPNFKKWNPDTRFRRKWFAISNDWTIDPKIQKLTPTEKLSWVLLLNLAARVGEPIVKCNERYVKEFVGCWGRDCKQFILKLLKLQLIDLRCENLHNITLHNITGVARENLASKSEPLKIAPKKAKRAGSKAPASPKDLKYQEAIGAYRKEFKKANYGAESAITAKQAVIFQQLAKKLPVARLEALFAVYFTMKDEWFIKTGYSIETFARDINKIIAHEAKTKHVELQALARAEQGELVW